MAVENQMTLEEKIAQIEATIAQIEATYVKKVEQFEQQKKQLIEQKKQLVAQRIIEEINLSQIDDDDFLSDLSSITVESPSKLLNNADIIKLRYYLNSAIILWRHGNDLDRYRLLDDISALAYKHLYDADDFIDIFSHKIEGKSVADIINMSKRIILDARQKQENHGQLTK